MQTLFSFFFDKKKKQKKSGLSFATLFRAWIETIYYSILALAKHLFRLKPHFYY